MAGRTTNRTQVSRSPMSDIHGLGPQWTSELPADSQDSTELQILQSETGGRIDTELFIISSKAFESIRIDCACLSYAKESAIGILT